VAENWMLSCFITNSGRFRDFGIRETHRIKRWHAWLAQRP